MKRRVGPVAAVLAAALAGCTPPPPERIAGNPAPVTVAPTGAQLLRLEIIARVGDRTARQGFEAYEPAVGLADYRRLNLVDVPGVGESAVDWSFTFRGAGGLQQVVDRMVVQGPAAVAVYYRTPQRDFERLAPIWRYAVDRLVIEPD